MIEYSIALCTYNGEKYIEEQLRSITDQTVKPAQIVVSDDGSTDNTLAIVHRILDATDIRHIITSNKGEHGVVPNFINAMHLCDNEIIFTSDQDDVWMKNKAEEMIKVFESDHSALLVLSNGDLVDENCKSLGGTTWNSVGITKQRQQEQDWFSYLLKVPLVTGAAMAVRRTLLDDIDTIPSPWLHDGWLGWAAVIRNSFRLCPHRLFLYRQHGNNTEGMAAQNAFTRIANWFSNAKTLDQKYKIRFKRYDSLWQVWGHRFNEEQQKELKQCREFWYELSQLKKRSIPKRVCTILHLYKNGGYSKYYTGTRGIVRDLILCIL